MKDRIRQIMESMHMTQQVFAQFLEIAPASLSGIFNDRTKPTLNTIEAIKKKIPNINTDWLMFGTGEMYVGDAASQTTVSPATQSTEGGLFDTVLDFPVSDTSPSSQPAAGNRTPVPSSYNSVKSTHQEIRREDLKIVDKPARRVVEIRVFYDDQTWESFLPTKK